MAIDNRLFQELHRLFLNGKLREVKRGGGSMPLAAPLSAQWLKPGDSFPQEAAGWEQARQWRSILNGITRTAAIIYGSRRIQVVFDRYDENYQYKPEREVIVASTEPALCPPPGFTLYHAADAMTGQVIHEAAHIRERQSEASPFADDPTLSLLHHLSEDAVIDQMIALEYPGFEGYLLAYRHYFIDWKLRNNWGFQAEGRLKQLILAMRSTRPDRVSRWSVRHAYLYLLYRLANARSVEELRRIDRVRLAEQLYRILYAARHAEHWREPDVLSESFVLGMDGPVVQGDKGNNRGGDELKPVTRSQIEQVDARELERRLPDDQRESEPQPQAKTGRRSRRTIGSWADEFRHGKDRHRPQSHSLSEEMQIMLHQLTEEDRKLLSDADDSYEAQVARLPLHAQAARRYRKAAEAVAPQIALLRSALSAARAGYGREEFALRAGSDLDDEALYRAKFAGDLFKRQAPDVHRDLPIDFVLLIDASYSMKEPLAGGDVPKYIVAQRLAALFVEALEPLDDMRAWVFSYSSLGRKVELRDLYSPDAGADKARIGDLYPAHQTPEYQALLAVSRLMGQTARAGVKKVYLVLSDGFPADDTMPRDRQIAEISKLTRQLEAAGDAIVHIALDSRGAADKVYPHRVAFPASGYAALIRRFGRLLEQWIS